jgi:hypothetical protein
VAACLAFENLSWDFVYSRMPNLETSAPLSR